MKAALVNASPKTKEKSSSGLLLQIVRSFLPEDVQTEELAFHRMTLPDGALQTLEDADAWVFFAPLFVDGLPAHLVSCLSRIQDLPPRTVYGVLNCGFMEGEQARTALEIMRNWAVKTGCTWGGGLGIGGGGALLALPDTGMKGPRGPVDAACSRLAQAISEGRCTGEEFLQIAFPRSLYKLAAQTGWRKSVRAYGGKARDLGARPAEE